MPWYFRRSIGRGPIRLNLSRSGLGVSVGMRGFRIGTGARGAYVRAGRGGFYYQQYLRASRPAPAPPQSPNVAPPHAPPEENVLGTSVEFIGEVDMSSDAYIAEVNRRRSAFRWSNAVFAVAILLAGVWAVKAAAGGWYAIPMVITIGGAALRHRENDERAIFLTYELEGDPAKKYEFLCDAFRTANASSMVWRLATQLSLSEGRRHGGATNLVTRTPTRIGFGAGSEIRTNVMPPIVGLTTAKLLFMPDKILLFAGNRISAVPYAQLRLDVQQVNFREDGPVPADATVVGTTWLFVNKNGSPDRRFNNNRQIPILAYSELSIQHAAFAFILQFSKHQVAARVAATLKLLGET